MEYDEATDTFLVRTAYGTSEALVAELRATTIRRDSTLVGRAATERRPLEIADLSRTDLDPHLEVLYRDGWRSVLAIPMVRGSLIVGVLVIRRRSVGAFPEEMVDLLETFASQSSVAIVNARLFRELAQKVELLEARARGRRSDQLQPRPQRGSRAHPRQRGPPLQCRRGPVDRVRRGREDVRHPPRARREREPPRSSGRADGRGGRADHLRPLRPAAMEGRVLEIPDTTVGRLDPMAELLIADGWRSLLSVPIRREQRLVGRAPRAPGPPRAPSHRAPPISC